MKRVFSIFALFLLSSVFVFGDYNRFGIPDSAEIRRAAGSSWFAEPLEMLRSKNSEIHANSIGQNFQIRMEESEDFFSVIIAPEITVPVDVYTDSGITTITSRQYPADISGSWVLVRNKIDGKPIRLRYYFSPDSDVFVQVSPQERYTLTDMMIFNSYAAQGLQVGIPFESFYTASIEQLFQWTESVLPWKYVMHDTGLYHSSLQMIESIREILPLIVPTEDAVYDEAGRPVYLSTGKSRKIEPETAGKLTLSEAGFVKWVVDGLIFPLTGSYTFRDPLLVPTVEYKSIGFQGIIDSIYDLSFALNWTRNLAAASLSVYANKNYLYDASGVDVKVEPFCAELVNGKIENTSCYIKNTGYKINRLQAILYVLAAENPAFCYLAAIRSKSDTSPEVRSFNHCAVIFPYFDSTGRFCCVVFQNGRELSLSKFIQLYKDDFVHLTRVQTEDRFFPQKPELMSVSSIK